MKKLFILSLMAMGFTATAQPVLKPESLKPTLTYTCDVDIDVSSNWINVISPDGTVQVINFPNQPVNPYKLNFNIKTKLKNPNAIIADYFYKPIKGGLGDFQKIAVRIDSDENLSLDCYMVTGSKIMKGQFIITYTERPVCP